MQDLSARVACSHRFQHRGGRFARATALGIGLACAAMASTARAGFSTINTAPTDETSQASILNHVYGGNFTLQPDGVDYSNGTLSVVRVSDYLPSSSSSANPGPNATDQLWNSSGGVTATAKALFAEDPSTPFGYIPGASGGNFQPLFSVGGGTFDVTGSGSFTPGSTFRFAAENKFGLLSSSPSDNSDGKDHMITYQVDGLGGIDDTWLLFFDDYGDNGTDADFDYQDLVIQVTTVPTTTSVPEPGTLMLAGGAAVVLLKRVRRRSR
jgi:hypothetical protein